MLRILLLFSRFTCGYCWQGFTAVTNFQTHILSKHLDVEGKYACEYCDFKTWDKYYLKKHVKKHEIEEGQQNQDGGGTKSVQKMTTLPIVNDLNESFEQIENEASLDNIFQQSPQSDFEKSNSEIPLNCSEVLENDDATQKTLHDFVYEKSIKDANTDELMIDEKDNEVNMSKPIQDKKMSKKKKDSPLKFSSIMTVTCKSETAKMYKEKFQSGGKGKCILFKEDWWTPNSFQEYAGSKSRKYLSSIKCLGRPLSEFVESGELTPTLQHQNRRKSGDIKNQYDKAVHFAFAKEEKIFHREKKFKGPSI